jgi:hypothetical protein
LTVLPDPACCTQQVLSVKLQPNAQCANGLALHWAGSGSGQPWFRQLKGYSLIFVDANPPLGGTALSLSAAVGSVHCRTMALL